MGWKRRIAAVLCAVVAVVAVSQHVANGYNEPDPHWPHSSLPLGLQVVDSMTADWDPIFREVLDAWQRSGVVEPQVVQGDESRRARRKCLEAERAVHVCNAGRGQGWTTFMIADGAHIESMTVQLRNAKDPVVRKHLLCETIGMALGLLEEAGEGHSCMTPGASWSDPAFSRPNEADFAELRRIYLHNDAQLSVDPHPDASMAVRQHSGTVR